MNEKMRVGTRQILTADLFETLLNNFPDIVHSVNTEGYIVFTNKKAEALLGYTRDELLSMHVRDLYATDLRDQVTTGFQELKDHGEKAIESVLQDKAGNLIPVEIRSLSLYDDHDNFMRTFSIIRDIRNIKALQENLVHSGRLAAIGEMSAGIAHDINNPLSVILMSLQMSSRVLDGEAPKPEQLATLASLLRDAAKAADVIRKLADHLRSFSRGVAEEIETVDLHAVIADSLFLTQNKIKNGTFSVVADVETGRHYTSGCPNKLQQVFVNLISNACDAMNGAADGSLTVSIEAAKSDAAPFWKCAVSDTGEGVPEEVGNHIFESFFTTKEKGKGTGLGLSISRGIVTEHGGFIRLDSVPGKGSTFSVFLPQVDPPARDAEAEVNVS